MKVAIIGSRTITHYNIHSLLCHLPKNISAIISGGAGGVDTWAESFAKSQGLPLIKILPDYEKYGRRAPAMRNKEIVRLADCVFAIWNCKSRGTAHTIVCCIRQGTPVRILTTDDN